MKIITLRGAVAGSFPYLANSTVIVSISLHQSLA